MIWRQLSRLVAVRLLLLVAIAATGPTSLGASGHALDSLGHRLSSSPDAAVPTHVESGALPPAAAAHCAACQFGAAHRVWTAIVTVAVATPEPERSPDRQPSVQSLRAAYADTRTGRAPPRAS